MRAEVPLAGLAQDLKVLPRQQEHAELHDRLDAQAMRGEAGVQIPERELRLFRERRGHGAIGAHADLPRDEHELGAGPDDTRVRVRPRRCVHVAWIDEPRHRGLPRAPRK